MKAYEVGQKVFAKVRGYPPWPARILDVTYDKSRNPRILVYFYGTKESANLKVAYIYPFIENIRKFTLRKRNKIFMNAVSEVMEDLTAEEKKQILKVSRLRKKNQQSSISVKKHTRIDPPSSCEINETKSDVSRYGRKLKPKSFGDVETSLCQSDVNASSEKNKIDFINVEFAGEKISVPKDAKRLKFHFTEEELNEIDIGLRKCLQIHNADLLGCIDLLDRLLKLDLTPLMIKKHPDIVQTIKKIRNYCGPPPKSSAITEKNKFIEMAEIIREKAEMVFSKIVNMFPVPTGLSFYDYFENCRSEFYNEIKNLSMQKFFDLVDV